MSPSSRKPRREHRACEPPTGPGLLLFKCSRAELQQNRWEQRQLQSPLTQFPTVLLPPLPSVEMVLGGASF